MTFLRPGVEGKGFLRKALPAAWAALRDALGQLLPPGRAPSVSCPGHTLALGLGSSRPGLRKHPRWPSCQLLSSVGFGTGSPFTPLLRRAMALLHSTSPSPSPASTSGPGRSQPPASPALTAPRPCPRPSESTCQTLHGTSLLFPDTS